jgi:pSer/pThr/pTyr-binding forkhead associated (FHA) protein
MSSAEHYLKIQAGPGKGKRFQVNFQAMVLGSSEEADIILAAPGVDARHAQIIFQGGKVILEDLGSRGGTFRNGQRLLAPLQVFPGDKIGLGLLVTIVLEGKDPRQPEYTEKDEDVTNPGFAPDGAEEG